jgi:hypothetical protein
MIPEFKAKATFNKALQLSGVSSVSVYHKLLLRIFSKNNKIRLYYQNKLLFFTPISFENFIKIKGITFAATFIFFLLISLTNMQIKVNDILSNYDYKTDIINSFSEKIEKDEQEKALKLEIQYFNALKTKYGINFLKKSKEEAVLLINLLAKNVKDYEIPIPKDTMVDKIYYRLLDYYKAKHINIALTILFALIFSFMLEGILICYNVFIKAETKQELRFLKKLIIMNGSIKPVKFLDVLEILKDNSKYYRHVMLDIEDKNKQNNLSKEDIYRKYIRNNKDINEKLFFEKLDEANNYNFEQAVINISHEFKIEKRELTRKVRKQIEKIHVIGLLGLTIILMLLVLYMIMPWKDMYSNINLG